MSDYHFPSNNIDLEVCVSCVYSYTTALVLNPMSDGPKTPSKRSGSNRKAPTIMTPARLGVGTPRPATKEEGAQRSKPKTPKTPTRHEKENNTDGNGNLASKPGRNAKMDTPKTSIDSVQSTQYLKAKTSRDVAELIALLRTAPSMKVVEVERGIDVDEDSFRKLIKLKVPIVFRGYASNWKCVKSWSKSGFLKRAAVTEAENLPHRKYRQFTAQSAEKGRLHLTDGKSKAKPVSLLEFLESTERETSSNGLYLLGIHAVGGNSSLSYCPVQPHQDDKDDVPPLSKDVPAKIDLLDWYAKYLADSTGEEHPVKYDHQQFFLARGYAFTDLHYDSYDNFYVAVTGKRRWTLACPTASRWLISSSSGKLKSGSNAIPHLKGFLPGSPAQIFPFSYIDLAPSDVLYVPNCWWHLVESCPGEDGFSSAFNFFFSKPPEKVFSDFQMGLTMTEGIVNSVQKECRENLASSTKTQGPVSLDDSLRDAPGTVSQNVWETLTALASVHHIEDWVSKLHIQHMSNSVERWSAAGRKVDDKSDVSKSEIDEPPKVETTDTDAGYNGSRNRKKN